MNYNLNKNILSK